MRAPVIASIAAAIVLALLLLPGVLIRANPTGAVTGAPPPGVDIEEVNRALEEQVRAREQQLARDVCTVEEAPRPRIEATPPSPAPRPPAGAGPARPNDSAQLRPPVRPEKTPVPNEALPTQRVRPDTLAKLLHAATVLVVAGNGTGTGFFVTPQLIVTNRHVVEDSDGAILVGNPALGQMRPVDRVAMTESSGPGQPDYALLRLKQGESGTFLSIAAEMPGQLQNVIAAGYPGLALTTDENFKRLREGDLRAIPELALTNGTVVVVQNRQSSSPLIIHHANIAQGNSGGPLVDECGRVLGVNTFVVTSRRRAGEGEAAASERDSGDRMQYALAAASTLQFLKQHSANPTIVSGQCVIGAASPPSAPPAAQPGPQPAPSGQPAPPSSPPAPANATPEPGAK